MAKMNTTSNMIPLVEDYYFSADENQYILYRCGKRDKIDIKTKKSTGEVIDFTETVGFYTTIFSMLKGCVRECNRRKIKNGEISNFKDCIKKIYDIYYNI